MGRWLVLYLLMPCAALAAPDATLNACLHEKLSMMAQAAGTEPEKIPGVDKNTMISALLIDGKATNVKAEKSSGNSSLDDAALACVKAFDFTAVMSEAERGKPHNISFDVPWQSVLVSAREEHSETHPFSIGTPHMCLSGYPPHLIREGVTGTAGLIFNITVEGKTSGILIAASSGNDELDQVSIGCARRWLYTPATRDGSPVEQSNMALVEYALSPAPAPWSPPLSNGPPRNCLRDAPGPADLIAATTGPTIVTYRLIAGEVTDPKVNKSSGSTELDSRAVSCVAAWRFAAVNRRGEPATHDQIAVIDWREADK